MVDIMLSYSCMYVYVYVQGKNDLAQELCKKTLVQNKSCSQALNPNPNRIPVPFMIHFIISAGLGDFGSHYGEGVELRDGV